MKEKLMPHNAAPYGEVLEMMKTENVFLYESAMGTGKTYITATLLKEKGFNALVLVPNNTLNHTWEKVAREFGIYIETMTYSMFARKELPEVYSMAAKYNVIVCDECHHVGADIWGGNLRKYRDYINGRVDTYMIGLTATRIRYLDNMNDVSRTFFKNNLIEGSTLGDAIAGGVLPTFSYVSAFFSLADDIEAIKEKLSKYALEKTEKLITRLQLDAANISSIDKTLGTYFGQGNHKTLVFVDKIDYIPETMARLEKVFGGDIFTVHSEHTQGKNHAAIRSFEKSENATMLAINMFNEGLHLDGVDSIVMLRRTTSANLFMQQLGRIMTPDNIEKELFVFDFVGNHKNLKTDERVIDFIEDLNREVTRKSGGRYQLIIDDRARDALKLLDDIGMFLPKSRAWTPEEDDILYEYYPKEKGKVYERLPGRTEDACKVRAGVLGIRRPSKPWTREEHDLVARYFPTEGADVAKRLPHRTKEACVARGRAIIRGLEFKDRTLTPWKAEELEILEEYYPLEGSKVSERLPGRTPTQCISCAQKRGIKSPRNWTQEERDLLKNLYPKLGEECFKMIPKKSVESCRNKVIKLKLK